MPIADDMPDEVLDEALKSLASFTDKLLNEIDKEFDETSDKRRRARFDMVVGTTPQGVGHTYYLNNGDFEGFEYIAECDGMPDRCKVWIESMGSPHGPVCFHFDKEHHKVPAINAGDVVVIAFAHLILPQ